jgi:hypothetical protein
MRLLPLSLSIASVVVMSLVQGCAAAPELKAVNLRLLGAGKCQLLDETFPCEDMVDALNKANVAKSATIQLQAVSGVNTVADALNLSKLSNSLTAAGFTGVSKTVVAVSSNDP